MVAFTLFFHYNLPPPEVTMVPHAVGVDDDITEVCIRLHCRGEDGGDKISQGEQNLDIQEEGRKDKVGD